MAIWEVRVVYKNGDRGWENVWHLDIGAETDVPPDVIDAFITTARDNLLSLYSVNRVSRRPAGSTDEFIETVVDLAGTIAIGGDIALPLFNVMRVALLGGVGRPGLKSLRGLLVATDLIDEQNHIDSALVTAVQTRFDNLFNAFSDAGVSAVFGSSNKVAVSPLVEQTCFMRQQHRKRKKTT